MICYTSCAELNVQYFVVGLSFTHSPRKLNHSHSCDYESFFVQFETKKHQLLFKPAGRAKDKVYNSKHSGALAQRSRFTEQSSMVISVGSQTGPQRLSVFHQTSKPQNISFSLSFTLIIPFVLCLFPLLHGSVSTLFYLQPYHKILNDRPASNSYSL